MCRANIHGHTDSKCFLQSSIYEVVIQEWTFTISLPNFLFSDLFLSLYLCYLSEMQHAPRTVVIYLTNIKIQIPFAIKFFERLENLSRDATFKKVKYL